MIHATAMGVVLPLLATEPEDRDPGLSEATHEAIPTAITTAGSDKETTEGDRREKAANRAVALKAVLPEAEVGLTQGERTLLSKWLDKIADPAS